MNRLDRNRESTWKCGRCNWYEDYTEEEPKVCPNCGYQHGQRDWKDVPEEIRLYLKRQS